MGNQSIPAIEPTQRNNLVSWLLEGDPAIRWQAMRDFSGASNESIADQRSRVAREGWGAQLLARQRADGKWGDDVAAPLWQSTLGALVQLKEFGVDPADASVKGAIDLVNERVTWGEEFWNSPFFEGEVEPCINGRTLGLGAYFGHPSERLLHRLLGEQLSDGGWNCEAERGSVRSSFHTTICVLEGLLEYEKSVSRSPDIAEARQRAETYLLERRLLRRLSTGEIISDRKGKTDWTQLAYPCTWHYDVLRGLDYFRNTGAPPDDRMKEAVEIVKKARRADGRWSMAVRHFDPVQFDMEGDVGEASRWITLRAMRVLDWAERG